ncbi:cytoplasmic dynein 2 intermediate chain 1 isoform X2 [Planococcus citri]|uniref:cytoplasmic dynein 2 intermediate chain 1 isoform X2 n=1 Tax=Planococcus citri TaxID=170843 RepID=UPI0031F8066E
MKKGGITEINSFIAVNNKSKLSPKKLPNKPASSDDRLTRIKSNATSTISPKKTSTTSPRSSSKLRSTNNDRVTAVPAQQNIKPRSTNDTSKTTVLKSKPIPSTKPSTSTSSQKTSKPTSSNKLDSPRASKPKPSTYLQEEKRGTSIGKITMEDVYKHRLRRTSQDSESSSRRSSTTFVNLVQDKDYESDFESCSESNESESREMETGQDLENEKFPNEEEKKMDSGSYDLYKQRQKNQLEVIKEALQKENTEVKRQNSPLYQNREAKIEEKIIDNDDADFLTNFNTKSLQNFSSAKKRQRDLEISNRIKFRGQKLLQMVTLDVMQYTLHEMSPVPYDIFMRCYARKDTSQAFVQTNEDNMSIEIQTEEIQSQSKWTQHPVELTKDMLNEDTNLQQVMLGVGDENASNVEQNMADFSARRLNEFMKTVGEELIALLEEESIIPDPSTENSSATLTKISDPVSCIKCNAHDFLHSRPIVLTIFDPHYPSRLLTSHGYSQQPDDNDRCSILCIWNIHQPSIPKMILRSYGAVTTCCFVAGDSSFLVAGHKDGSLCVWDLRDNSLYSEKIKLGNVEVRVRSPSYNSAEILKNVNHNSSVIKVESTPSVKEDSTKMMNDFKTQIVFSIEEENYLIIWSLSRSYSTSNDIGLAPWSKIKFFSSQIIDIVRLFPKFSFRTTTLNVLSESKILLGTNTGLILKCSSYDKKCKIYSKYESASVKGQSKVTCLEVCPYDENYFAVGYGNGNIRLYNYNYSEPVSNLEQRDVSSVSVQSLQWLWNKHNYILSLDLNFKLCVYRFSSADYSLTYSAQIEDINSVVVSPFVEHMKDANPYLVLVSNKGNIEIQKFNAMINKTTSDDDE